jgi:phosphate transport system permease protein
MIENGQPAAPDFSSFASNSLGRRRGLDRLFKVLCWIVTLAALSLLGILLYSIAVQSLPMFRARPDLLESAVWASVVQGVNSGNQSDRVDDGDLLQGVFVAERLAVGGLQPEDDVRYNEKRVRLGLFCFELRRNPDEPLVFDCRPCRGEENVESLLKQAGFETASLASAGQNLTSSVIAIFETDSRDWNLDQIDGSEGLMKDGKLAAVLWGGSAGLQCKQILGISECSETGDFCQVQFNETVSEEEGGDGDGLYVSVESIESARRKKKIAKLTGLFSLLDHQDGIRGAVNLNLRKFTSEQVRAGQVALTDDDGVFIGLPNNEKRGFQFGGKFSLSSNFLPEQGSPWRHLATFLQQVPKNDPLEAGIGPALSGTLWVCLGCALFALPLGIGTAIVLEEFRPKTRLLRWLHGFVQLNIANLAGVPSIVYGIVGLTAFGTMFDLFGSPNEPHYSIGAKHYYQYIPEGGGALLVPLPRGSANQPPKLVDGMDVLIDGQWAKLKVIENDEALPVAEETLRRTLYADAEGGPTSIKSWYYFQVPLGRGVLAASLTLMLVILPVIIISTQESLRGVPDTLPQGALGIGATRWQSVRHVTLPAALPGIMTGAILAMSRAIGEAAPIIVLCGKVYVSSGPQHLMDTYSVLPVQLFYWAGQPFDETAAVNFQHVVSAGILVLLVILFCFNALAITIRQWTQKPLS